MSYCRDALGLRAIGRHRRRAHMVVNTSINMVEMPGQSKPT